MSNERESIAEALRDMTFETLFDQAGEEEETPIVTTLHREEARESVSRNANRYDEEYSVDYRSSSGFRLESRPKPRKKTMIKMEKKIQVAKTEKKAKDASVKLSWFVKNGVVVPAEKRPTYEDVEGYSYLLFMDWDDENFPYTVLEGKYYGTSWNFIFGKQSEDVSIVLMLRRRNGKNYALETFDTATEISTYVISELQTERGVENKARQSGYDFLTLKRFKMPWMSEARTRVTLKCARKEIEAHVCPVKTPVRDARDLFGSGKKITYVEDTRKNKDRRQQVDQMKTPERLDVKRQKTEYDGEYEEGISIDGDSITLVPAPIDWQVGRVLDENDVNLLSRLKDVIKSERSQQTSVRVDEEMEDQLSEPSTRQAIRDYMKMFEDVKCFDLEDMTVIRHNQRPMVST